MEVAHMDQTKDVAEGEEQGRVLWDSQKQGKAGQVTL